ncbi:cellulose synthase [Sinorhizobium medicae]|nr:cellulose synthase [Sinorhizobium medicae]MDX0743661.1 cellulose synthase [Sinorhizobium medicae]
MKFPIVASIGVVTAALAAAGLAGDGELPRGLAQVIVDADRADDASTAVQLSQAHGPAAPESTQDPPPLRVDESALRYFASKGDTARLEAEIARLRALYPNWTPPQDPLSVPQNSDAQLETMWRLYSEGRYAEVRRAIAERQSTDPDWQVPTDLLERLNVAEARARLVNASDLKQYETVIQVGAGTPSLLTCSDNDVLWRVAEAFAVTKRPNRARDAYLYILKNCDNEPERLATVQKAASNLSYSSMQDLLSYERTNSAGALEFESIRDDLARRFVAAGDEDSTLEVDPKYLQRVERLAETEGSAADALLLGWYQLRRKNMNEAERWFRLARDKQDSAPASQGLSLVLIERKAPEEAEKVLYPWRDASSDARATYFAATANLLAIDPPVALSADVLQRIAQETMKSRDAATAQQFGWYARLLGQPATAVQWFSTTLGWKPDDEPSAYGLAISHKELGDIGGVAEIQRLWAAKSDRIARLGDEVDGQAKANTAPPGSATIAAGSAPIRTAAAPAKGAPLGSAARGSQTTPRKLSGCRSTIDPRGLPPGAALARGWCLMDLNRPLEAAEAFEVALRASASKLREDAAYGQSLAYLRAGLTGKAAVAAARSPQSLARRNELQTAILADRAVAAFDAGRYNETLLFLEQRRQLATERTDLMVLRGYAYLKLKRYAQAKRIFEAAAATGNRDAIRGLSDVLAEQQVWPRKF